MELAYVGSRHKSSFLLRILVKCSADLVFEVCPINRS